MEKVLSTLATMPAFIIDMFTEHPAVSVAGVLVFLLALMVPGRIGSLLRKVVILANVLFAMAGGFMGRLQNGYQIICLSAISLLILFIIRMTVRINAAIRQRKIDARIEEKALAKAAKRRGSFKKRQGYSGEPREADDEDFVPPSSSHAEIRQVIEDEINEGKAREEATIAAYESEISDTDGSEGFEEETEDTEFDSVGERVTEKTDEVSVDRDFDDRKEPSYIPLQSEDNPYPAGVEVPNDLPEGVFYVRPRPFTGQTAQQVLENDIKEALKRLAELRDNGILTDAEFEDKKTELLTRIKTQ